MERKVPVKDEFDTAVPKHELLDSSINKGKSDLVSRSRANRQLPSSKKSNSNSSSNCTLDESEEEPSTDGAAGKPYNGNHYSTPVIGKMMTQPPSVPLYAQVHKNDSGRNDSPQQPSLYNLKAHSTIPNIYHNEVN